MILHRNCSPEEINFDCDPPIEMNFNANLYTKLV